MTKTVQLNFRILPDTIAQLEAVRDRDGIRVSEQLRRAVDLWLREKAREHAVLTQARKARTVKR